MAAVQPIPERYPQVTPYLCVDGASAAIAFYGQVLGATGRASSRTRSGTAGASPPTSRTCPPRR
jgi:PhnB protein